MSLLDRLTMAEARPLFSRVMKWKDHGSGHVLEHQRLASSRIQHRAMQMPPSGASDWPGHRLAIFKFPFGDLMATPTASSEQATFTVISVA
uniref:Uncharacterized protein n=1 Tax=Kalanchoe fedtschenkoi TaxID=63787 RepID=A0A7N0T3N8_KALFE